MSSFDGQTQNQMLLGWNFNNGYSPSNYYPPTIPGIVYNSGVNGLTADYVIYVPFVCRVTNVFTRLAYYNTGTGDSGDDIRMGLYESAEGRPTTLIVDGGELAITGAAALNESTISTTLIGGRLYFMAITANGAINGYRATAAPTSAYASAIDMGVTEVSAVPGLGGIGYMESRAYAALPSTVGTLTKMDLNSTVNQPLFWLKG